MKSTKTALITGGSRGLGKNAALALAANGADIIITYHTRADEANKVVAAIKALGRNAAAVRLDVSDTAGFPAFFENVKQILSSDFGRESFDFLVNNAGTGMYVPFTETTEAQFDQMYNIHLKSVYFLTQHALPILHDGGGIVNISSGLARFSFAGSSAYATMKGGVEVMTRYMARELGSRGIRANVVAPGAIETDFGNGRVRDNKDINDHIASLTALGRVGLPDDIGGVVAFLCSEQARWVNGQRIEVSGGIFL